MILKGDQLSYKYTEGSRQIINQFSIAIDNTEIVGLSAPSGFGKTTLCKILAGYEKPDAGSVTMNDQKIQSLKGYCPVQMIWQHPELVVNPKLKMADTLDEVGGVDQRILKGLGIESQWLTRYPTELSGGELQRFCIARALKEPTRFILADEITTMLDLITQAQIWHFLIKEVKERAIGLMVVSHSDGLLEQLCSRIIKMNTD